MKQPHPRTNYHASAWHRVSWCSWCCQKKEEKSGLIIYETYEKGWGRNGSAFFVVRPAGRTYLEVQVLYTPDRGKY
jgi:hypothetical protein